MPAGPPSTWTTYRLGGRLLRTNVELVELEPASGEAPEIRCELLPPIAEQAERREWFHGWRLAGDDGWWMQAADVGGEYLVRFPGMLDARVSADGTHVRCFPLRATPMETVRHLLLDQVLPLAIGLSGDLVLHAAAVAVDGEALAFVGPTGSGKSTLAAWLGTHGWAVLTDDCLVVEEQRGDWRVLPYYGGVRLWPSNLAALLPGDRAAAGMAHYSRKVRVPAPGGSGTAGTAQPLGHLCFLQAPEASSGSRELAIEPLSPRDALMALVRASFLLEIRSPDVLARQFDALGRLVDAVPCVVLRYPREHAALPEIHDAIRSHLLRGEATGLSRRERSVPPAEGR